MVFCFLCNYEAQCTNHLFKRFHIFHDLKAIDKFNCPLKHCLRNFNSIDTYKRHLKQHKFDSKSSLNIDPKPNNLQSTNYNTSLDKKINLNINTEDNINQNHNIPSSNDFQKLQSDALSMICKWYSDTVIPRNKIDILIKDVQDLIDSIVSVFSSKIENSMNKCSDTIVKDELSLVLSEMKILSAPFINMKTEYLRFKKLDELGVLIQPKEIIIGHRLDDRLIDGTAVADAGSEVKICLTSLRDLLKKVIEHSNLFDVILEYKESMLSSKFIFNFMQSQQWQEKCQKNLNKTIFLLFLYYDDFEVTNPLGSHAGSQKLGAIYIYL